MAGLLSPILKESYLGRAEVRNTFRVKGAGTIAGCYVTDGSSSATKKYACCAAERWFTPARSAR